MSTITISEGKFPHLETFEDLHKATKFKDEYTSAKQFFFKPLKQDNTEETTNFNSIWSCSNSLIERFMKLCQVCCQTMHYMPSNFKKQVGEQKVKKKEKW